MPNGEAVETPDARSRAVTIARAFAVHMFTSAGAALALLALIAAVNHNWSLMFLWLGIALFVDGIDGTFARRFRVREVLPRWSGDVLDLVVDFLTYVFVPTFAIMTSGLLPPKIDILIGVVIVVTSALYFADRRMKTSDNYFLGFPALWNAVAFYLFIVRPDPWVGAVATALIAAATFVPYPFVHPFRVERLRILNLVLLAAWAVLAAIALVYDMSPGQWVTVPLCALAVYFLAAGLMRRPG